MSKVRTLIRGKTLSYWWRVVRCGLGRFRVLIPDGCFGPNSMVSPLVSTDVQAVWSRSHLLVANINMQGRVCSVRSVPKMRQLTCVSPTYIFIHTSGGCPNNVTFMSDRSRFYSILHVFMHPEEVLHRVCPPLNQPPVPARHIGEPPLPPSLPAACDSKYGSGGYV